MNSDRAIKTVGFQLWKISNEWQKVANRTLEPFDLTYTQYIALSGILELLQGTEDITQIDLSKFIEIDPMTCSSVIRTLLNKNFITRHSHPNDSRKKVIAITEFGTILLQRASLEIELAENNFFVLPNKNRLFSQFDSLYDKLF
ncbi:MAG: MarR family transcriptional regulator [Leptospiraceae bacterium]|nr:MarR family transcriptional regulator [Leptospiraceae bacterium]